MKALWGHGVTLVRARENARTASIPQAASTGGTGKRGRGTGPPSWKLQGLDHSQNRSSLGSWWVLLRKGGRGLESGCLAPEVMLCAVTCTSRAELGPQRNRLEPSKLCPRVKPPTPPLSMAPSKPLLPFHPLPPPQRPWNSLGLPRGVPLDQHPGRSQAGAHEAGASSALPVSGTQGPGEEDVAACGWSWRPTCPQMPAGGAGASCLTPWHLGPLP